MPKLICIVLVVAASLVIASPIAATDEVAVQNETVSAGAVPASGGGAAASDSYSTVATFGQPLVGSASSSANLTYGGFWPDYVYTLDIVAVRLAYLTADPSGDVVVLRWGIAGEEADHLGFHVYRQRSDQDRLRITETLLPRGETYEFIDSNPPPGILNYWLEEFGRSGDRTWHGPLLVDFRSGSEPGAVFLLLQNRPNPFRSTTLLSFQIPQEQSVLLRIIDLTGREVARLVSGSVPSGVHEVYWDGRDNWGRPVSSGIYFYRLDATGVVLTRKLILLP